MEMSKSEKHVKTSFTIILLTILVLTIAGSKIQLAQESFENASLESTSFEATVYVDPPTAMAKIYQEFSVNISISNVTDLYGWEFKFKWDATLLEATNITEGNFLKGQGDTLFVININNTEGYVRAACTLIGSIPGANGSGTLATIKFYVETLGECVLDLYDTKLVSSTEQPIEHTTIDGYYYTSVHDVAIINLTASATTINVTVENQGTHTETFNVSTYYTLLTDPLIGTQTITLTKGTNSTLTFTWTPPSLGRYEILAEAETVPGETDIADNTRAITISIGYSSSSSSSESVNGYHTVLTLFALFAVAMIIPKFRKKKRPQIEIAATILRHNLPNNTNNLWNDWIRRQLI